MSPEQAKGRPADKRSDVWAFGAVLYEMLSGQRAFKGDDIADTLAAVLRQDIDWNALPRVAARVVRRLIARCLDRDVRRRLRDIGEARIALDGPVEIRRRNRSRRVTSSAAPAPGSSDGPRRARRWAARRRRALVRRSRNDTAAARCGSVFRATARRTEFHPADQRPQHRGVARWPARRVRRGQSSVSEAAGSGEEPRPIPGTEGFVAASNPAFWPDSRSIAFFAVSDRTLRTIAVTGGSATRMCSIAAPYGISWGPTGILVGQGDKGIIRVSLDDMTPQVILRVKEGEEAHGPQLLPDGQHVLSRWLPASTSIAGTGRASCASPGVRRPLPLSTVLPTPATNR